MVTKSTLKRKKNLLHNILVRWILVGLHQEVFFADEIAGQELEHARFARIVSSTNEDDDITNDSNPTVAVDPRCPAPTTTDEGSEMLAGCVYCTR